MSRVLLIDQMVWQTLKRSAREALPREVGGILLGYYQAEGPRVVIAPVVPDPRATRIRYRRDARAAALILEAHQNADVTGLLGYLGEWHTHPLPVGPSNTDVASAQRLAKDGGHDVALLVIALGPGGWVGHARTVRPAGSVRAIPLQKEANPT